MFPTWSLAVGKYNPTKERGGDNEVTLVKMAQQLH